MKVKKLKKRSSDTPIRKIQLLFIMFSFLSLIGIVFFIKKQTIFKQYAAASTGKTYYVSKNGSNADGTTWTTAWNELANINWTVINPGDTILIDGGTNTMTYTTTLTISKSGIQGSPITIGRSSDSGHNGQVIIFGGRTTPLPYCEQTTYTNQTTGVLNQGIYSDGQSWITIDGKSWGGIKVYGFANQGIRISNNISNNITLRNLEIYDNGFATQQTSGAWEPDGTGIWFTGSNLTFERMNIYDNGQDDLQSSGTNNLVVDYSWLHVTREDPNNPGLPFNQCAHQDGLQIYNGGVQGPVDFENTIIGPGLKEGIILGQTPYSGTPGATVNNVTLRNTLFLNKVNNIFGYPQVKETGWNIDHVTVWNLNTLQQGAYPSAIDLEGSGHSVTNSIFYGGPMYLPDGLANSSNNCQWNTTGNTAAIVGQTVDPKFATDISGYDDSTSLTTLANTDYTLQTTSPCVGLGSSLTSVAQLITLVNTLNTPAATPTAIPTNTPTPTNVPTNTPSPTPTTFPSSIYTDSLLNGWQNRSWASTVNLANTYPVHSGSKSITFTANAWGGFYLYNPSLITISPYTYLDFFARAAKTNQQYKVFLYDVNNNAMTNTVLLANYGGTPPTGSWKEYLIPFSALRGSNTQMHGFAIQSTLGTNQSALYLDDIRFK